jgi:hypothetical protein
MFLLSIEIKMQKKQKKSILMFGAACGERDWRATFPKYDTNETHPSNAQSNIV